MFCTFFSTTQNSHNLFQAIKPYTVAVKKKIDF